ncbi:COP9 signalosome complex subunit 1 [Echinops telfairi]|uniref:COP9 signalosome complex subunit 1 n=1 Tax=Echinops telfairi TaxID=9371 RepID=A0ABM0IWD7_ECHTE|nr:COP9 signalosome complex subunit 1 [Echinops telfairi]
MRESPAPSSASSSVTELYCAPPNSRADLGPPATAGDFSLSASLSACTLLYEGAVEPMQIDVDPQEDPQNASDVSYVVENPTLDLEQYAASYSGLMRIERLQFIADHCPPLRVEALKMALSFVQRTFNVDMYEEVHRKLSEATSHVLSYVSKAESTPEIAEQRGERDSQTQAILTKLKCAAGLAELAARKYKQAAKCFLLASFDHCDFPELLSPSNVAVYGGLCALATFDRQELQRNVIASSSFKLFLELEPQVRDIIFKFYESKYASCLKMLDEMKDNLLLDMYLAPHVRTLYTQIRNRALIQYFSPYVSADMRKMATAFNTTVAALEDELTQLILEGLINARIDSHSKILHARDVDQRSTTFEKSLLMGKEFQRRAKAMILRAAVLRNQIHVKSPPREGSQGELTPANSQSRMTSNM